jgi:hypothetical protein
MREDEVRRGQRNRLVSDEFKEIQVVIAWSNYCELITEYVSTVRIHGVRST